MLCFFLTTHSEEPIGNPISTIARINLHVLTHNMYFNTYTTKVRTMYFQATV
jgi:hypothetical protein